MSNECLEPGPMPFHELQRITNDFSKERRIGTGAYGSVYMGMYEDGRKVAVKVLHEMSGFDEKLFETEFHNLERLHHENIVGLIGYCHEIISEFLQHNGKTVLAGKIKMALCMEYMPNRSLDKHISDEYNGHTWHTRYKIIKGICSGLKYLHEELENPFYHLDLKPDNIFLDEEMVPKIGDFGLSRFFAEQQTQITSACIGTRGYMPPEYIEQKAISIKFDIYSLGVVMIQIISGREGFTNLYTMESEEFINLVRANWRRRLNKESMSGVQSSLELVMTCTKIALRCLEDDRRTRPTIGEIVNELICKETTIQFPEALSIQEGSSIDQVSLCTSTEIQSMDVSKKQESVSFEVKESESMKVEPGQLCFHFEPNKLISCLLHLTNKTDKNVAFRCIPKASGVYTNDLQHVRGLLPPNMTRTFVATMEKRQTLPSSMDQLAVIVESCIVIYLPEAESCLIFGEDAVATGRYFEDANKQSGCNVHEVTLLAVCEMAGQTATSKKEIEQTVKIFYRGAGLGEVFSTDVHPTEPWILVGHSTGSIAVWNYNTQTRVMALKIAKEDKEPGPFSFLRKKKNHTLRAFSAKFIVREKWFAAGDGFGYIHVHKYDTMLTGRSGPRESLTDKVKKFYAHAGAVTSLAVHPSGPFLLSASTDKLIKLWEWENGWKSTQVYKRHKHRVEQVVFNPRNSSSFASVSADGTILIWNISSTIPITKMNREGYGFGYGVDYFSISGDCQCLLAVCREGNLNIRDLQAETCVKSLTELQPTIGRAYRVSSAAVVDRLPLQDNPMLVLATQDSAICLYDCTVHRYKRKFYFGLGRVHHITYIRQINCVAIAFEEGLAIMEIEQLMCSSDRQKCTAEDTSLEGITYSLSSGL